MSICKGLLRRLGIILNTNKRIFMNLVQLYGPTVTLKELCKILKISRSSYYNFTKKGEGNNNYKSNFPTPMHGFNRNLFVTDDVEEYLSSFSSTN